MQAGRIPGDRSPGLSDRSGQTRSSVPQKERRLLLRRRCLRHRRPGQQGVHISRPRVPGDGQGRAVRMDGHVAGRGRDCQGVGVVFPRPEPDAATAAAAGRDRRTRPGGSPRPTPSPGTPSFGLSCFAFPSFQSNSDDERVADAGEGVRHVRDPGNASAEPSGAKAIPRAPPMSARNPASYLCSTLASSSRTALPVHVPVLDDALQVARDEPVAVGVEGDVVDVALVPASVRDRRAVGGGPELDEVVVAARGDQPCRRG